MGTVQAMRRHHDQVHSSASLKKLNASPVGLWNDRPSCTSSGSATHLSGRESLPACCRNFDEPLPEALPASLPLSSSHIAEYDPSERDEAKEIAVFVGKRNSQSSSVAGGSIGFCSVPGSSCNEHDRLQQDGNAGASNMTSDAKQGELNDGRSFAQLRPRSGCASEAWGAANGCAVQCKYGGEGKEAMEADVHYLAERVSPEIPRSSTEGPATGSMPDRDEHINVPSPMREASPVESTVVLFTKTVTVQDVVVYSPATFSYNPTNPDWAAIPTLGPRETTTEVESVLVIVITETVQPSEITYTPTTFSFEPVTDVRVKTAPTVKARDTTTGLSKASPETQVEATQLPAVTCTPIAVRGPDGEPSSVGCIAPQDLTKSEDIAVASETTTISSGYTQQAAASNVGLRVNGTTDDVQDSAATSIRAKTCFIIMVLIFVASVF